MDRSEALASFMAVTDASEAISTQMLEATGWALEAAIELFFATSAAEGDADAEYARALASEPPPSLGEALRGAGDFADDLEDAVRPADERFHDVLAGVPVYAPGPHVPASAYLPGATGGVQPVGRPRPALAAFRDFRAEGQDDPQELLEPGGGVGPSPGFRRARAQDSGLAGLFAPPTELLFGGTFEQAREAATQLDRWILVNVQSNSEFASHQLNRDLWHHETVNSIVAGTFVFMQLHDVTEEGAQRRQHSRGHMNPTRSATHAPLYPVSLSSGRKILTFYQLFGSYGVPPTLPVTLLLDPITGMKMHQWTGFVEPDKFVEDTVRYCDAAPSESAGPHKKHKPSRAAAPPATEDQELRAAIEASLHQSAQAVGASMEEELEGGDEDEFAGAEEADKGPQQPAPPAPPGADGVALAEAARASLPEEPSAGEGACTVALRLPDGARTSRRFCRLEPAATLRTWVLATVPAAAAGRRFRLAQPGPLGGPATLLEDGDAAAATTVEGAGLVNALLAMTWVD